MRAHGHGRDGIRARQSRRVAGMLSISSVLAVAVSGIADGMFSVGPVPVVAGVSAATISPPTMFSAAATSSSMVNLSWGAPATLTGYSLSQSPGTLAGCTATPSSAATSCTATGLTAGTNYTWTLKAVYNDWASTAVTAATVTFSTVTFSTAGGYSLTVPAHDRILDFQLVGAGGGSGASGGAGGAGGSSTGVISIPDSATPTQLTVEVGAAGAGGSAQHSPGVGGNNGTGLLIGGNGAVHQSKGGGGGQGSAVYVVNTSHPIVVAGGGGGGGGGDTTAAGGAGSGGATPPPDPGTSTGGSGGGTNPGSGGSAVTSGSLPFAVSCTGGAAGALATQGSPTSGTTCSLSDAGGNGATSTGTGDSGGGGGGGFAGGGGGGADGSGSHGGGAGGGAGYTGGAQVGAANYTVTISSLGTGSGTQGGPGSAGYATFSALGLQSVQYSATGAVTAWPNSNSTQTVNYPTTPVTNQNDLLFLVAENSADNAPGGTPSGWTLLADQGQSGMRFSVWWKLAGSSDSSVNLKLNAAGTGVTAAAWVVRYVRQGGYPSNPAAALPTTTVALGSNGASLPQSTISVGSTTGLPSGTFQAAVALSSTNVQVVSCTGTAASTLTGCSGGTGTMATGDTVALTSQGTAALRSTMTPTPNVTTNQTLSTVISFAASESSGNPSLSAGQTQGFGVETQETSGILDFGVADLLVSASGTTPNSPTWTDSSAPWSWVTVAFF